MSSKIKLQIEKFSFIQFMEICSHYTQHLEHIQQEWINDSEALDTIQNLINIVERFKNILEKRHQFHTDFPCLLSAYCLQVIQDNVSNYIPCQGNNRPNTTLQVNSTMQQLFPYQLSHHIKLIL
ncbi:MAG: hypothetical protein HAW62_01560 [Endozoicomonadaceae bacterium]|nr:hypothetical protein [Endozoicomonadaceae bacterium]